MEDSAALIERAADATPTKGIHVTAKEQIEELSKIGCEDAIKEIKSNNGPLSSQRLNHHIEIAIGTGLVARVEGLATIRSMPLTRVQVERLTNECLRLEWIVDAVSASKLGTISEQTRHELIEALVSKKMVENQEEAILLLEGKE
jgi:hypothetical protein